MKKAIHAMWNARICGEEKFVSSMRVALSDSFFNIIGGSLLSLIFRAPTAPPNSIVALANPEKHSPCP